MTALRLNADGSVVCAHRDLSCCERCLAADEQLVDVYGVVYLVPDAAERAALRAELAEAGQP
jgi:hypothetical protein